MDSLALKDAMFLIPAFPFAGAVVLLLAGRRLREPLGGLLATAMMGAAFLTSGACLYALQRRPEEYRQAIATLFTWLPSGSFRADVQFNLDTLSVTMCLVVTGVGALIHMYSVGYMHGDPAFTRYFAYLNLFAGFMLVLVLANNLLLMFVGWEGVGLCSYLLIGFWFQRRAAATAAKKAFVTNRVGDAGFLIALFLCFATFGTVQMAGPGALLKQAESGLVATGTLTAIGVLFLVACAGKSAQIPLFTWLPDAMEGPSPVSALIHAATMVTAGVYLVVRMHPIFDFAPGAADTLAIGGAVTAFLAATIACAQYDIKKVLAYSTISQLGFMFLACGVGAYAFAVFHLVTHAFFKALLFLGAGSVMHGLHDETDMRRMGGLARHMPVTAATFVVGWLALAGLPPLAGFWSKDAILGAAFHHDALGKAVWGLAMLTALITAFYSSRQVFLVFFGDERFATDGEHGVHPHESPPVMTLPLMALAGLAAVGGLVNLPFGRFHVLGDWLNPVVAFHGEVIDFQFWLLLGAGATAAVIGIAVAFVLYRLDTVEDRARVLVGMRLQGLHSVLRNKWFIDDAYGFLFAGAGKAGAAWMTYVLDARIVDGAVDGVGTGVRGVAEAMRRVQSGYVRVYALAVLVGAVGVFAFLLFQTGGG